MRPQSAKAKGRRFQQELVELILQLFPSLQSDDVQWRSMGAGGEDIILSPAARAVLPLSAEAKNQESLSIWKALAQAAANAKGYAPVLFFKRNRSEAYAALPAATLLSLYAELARLKAGNPHTES